MAIQLNERDQQIFKLIEEHHVLLEKHIAWFISKDNKPVLIRDRLRKLFYLDYLLCGRHAEILPWWTTPTKPLVYTLSALARHTINGVNPDCDLNESKIQRHFLELANLRMLLLIAQKDGLISSVQWTTMVGNSSASIEAKVSFVAGNEQRLVGIINSPFADGQTLVPQLEAALAKSGINQLWIICQDNIHQALLQRIVASENSFADKILFATHSDLYNLGIVKSKWQTADRQIIAIVDQAIIDAAASAASANAGTGASAVSADNIWPLPAGSFPHAATA
jgi:hypothetical protein